LISAINGASFACSMRMVRFAKKDESGARARRFKLASARWPRARIALETGTHSLWVSELLADLGHEVIVAHVREVRAITGSHSKSD
jgi:hypothetical protein